MLRQPPQAAYPVEHVCPALHGDALKHSEHGKGKVVEVVDATIRANPATPTLRAVGGALASSPENAHGAGSSSATTSANRGAGFTTQGGSDSKEPVREGRESTRPPLSSQHLPQPIQTDSIFKKLHFTYLAVPSLSAAHEGLVP